GFTFYPNPTMDVLNLRANSSIDTVELYTMLGQKVISQEIGATASQVNVSNLATGTYIMKVTAEGQTASYQVIKK
ncbi:MAG: T9SS type A sorting domain-containing protein, partial [Flavobacteriaceae bacterium]|nr:T9SS type A sorting domain-containing protein [Flavobacteriaceae bacterium]